MYTHISTFTDVHTCSHTYAHTHRLACTYAWSHTDTLTETYSSTDQHKLINTGTQKCIHLYKCTHIYTLWGQTTFMHYKHANRFVCLMDWMSNLHGLLSSGSYILHTLLSLPMCSDFKESCIRNMRECISPLYPPLCSHRHSCTFPKHTISCQDFLNDLYNSLYISTAFAILNNTVWVQVCVGCVLYAESTMST